MRIAFFSPPLQGHLQPAAALAAALAQRGHDCFLIAHPDTQLPKGGFTPLWLDAQRCRVSPGAFEAHARKPGLPFGVRRIVGDMVGLTDAFCAQGSALLRQHGIDGVISDQMEPAGALVADGMGLPFVSLAAAHPINREPLVPLPVLPWPYEDSDAARQRNAVGEWIADFLTAPHDRAIARWSAKLGGRPKRKLTDCLSPLADIAQFTQGLDFPRRELAPSFHYIGRLRHEQRAGDAWIVPQPGRPLVYATFGTLQGHRLGLFQRIARACRALGAQLLVSHGGALSEAQAQQIDADFVVPWVEQEAILKLADAVVTHGGLNTVLDSLAAGVPLLCIPVAFEQPGIAARIARAGVGEVLPARASADSIATDLEKVLREPGYRQRAAALGAELAVSGDSARAAEIVELALRTRQPVRRPDLAVAA